MITGVAIAAAVVIAAALFSMWGSVNTKRDLASGRPRYESLGDHTGVWSRAELERRCGKPDATGRYAVPPDLLAKLPRSPIKRWIDNIYAQLAAIGAGVLAWLVVNQSPTVAVVLLAVFGGYQLIGWAYTTYILFRFAELETPGAAAKEKQP